ncbi:chromosome segregation protein SMC [Bellilinea sp.]|uniref:chromosome segregation protein SMC n=1 Tax=Bellilinea sp. TaxID=2838785 RepID=UPI002ADDA429|nr:chromosome segregation protein SMC [Bellilinea sp.]
MTSRLKTLELQGYKTFASRTVFEFPGRITAIVGPNGSGKSNIADAIRWVLGEQSYTLLRGRKTEDMIFAGSELRPRASMASAMITFENEDGWLPIDYGEVSIARRAYRDGQNEYLLNGQRVRLKEISEILAQSGLAERTYTIIGQGLVDAALSLRPEERRKFFEEAAGIGLYRSRREEALNRLEQTRRNLERVQDILSELEPRLKSLEKQAARVIEYERIKADLRLLLREWYGYQWQRMQAELTHAREVLTVQENRLHQVRQQSQQVEKRVQEVRLQIQRLREVLNEWHAQSAEVHRQREEINRILAVLDERQRSLTDQKATTRHDLTRLEEESQQHSKRLQAVQEELTVQQAALEEAKQQAGAAQKAFAEKKAQRDQVEGELRDLRRKLTRLETQQVEVKARQRELNNRLERLRSEENQLTQQIPQMTTTLHQAEAELLSVQQLLESLQDRRQQIEERLRTLQKQQRELEESRSQLQEQNNAIRAELARKRAEMKVLEQAERNYNGLGQGVKVVMTAAEQKKIKGSIQPLSRLIQVPSELTTAVAAVLGESLEGLTIEADVETEEVLQFLENMENGRAVLFPLEWLRGETHIPAPKEENVFGNAADVVVYPAAIKRLVMLLLGKVWIVRDRQTARRLIQNQPADLRIVTLSGEVFFGSGEVRAGKENRAELISRPRQLKELNDEIRQLEARLAEGEGLVAENQKQREAFEQQRRVAERELSETQEQEKFQQRNLQKITMQVEQTRQKLSWQQSQVEQLRQQTGSSQKEREDLIGQMNALTREAQQVESHVREVQRALNNLMLDDLQSQVIHWNTQVSVMERVLQDMQRRLNDFQQALERNEHQQQTYRERLNQLDRLMEELEAEKTKRKAEAGQLNQAIEEVQAKIQPAEEELNELESRYENLQKDLSAAQQNTAVAERHATQAQLEFGRIRENLESLRRRVEEDFGLVAFEYQNEVSGPTPLPLEGMVEQLPVVKEISPDLEENINRQRSQLRRMGAINPDAHSEYLAVKERYEFLIQQVADLKKADQDLREIIGELDGLMKKEFRKTFDAVAAEFKENFARLFGGGSARLVLENEESPIEGGIDIEARLPGRREQGLSLLSGGERSLTAVALIFSLLKVSPTPFCVLDEVDAMLDESNVGRFCELLQELSHTTQFIVITHNRNTVQVADVIYGVTMGKDTASQVISLRLDEVGEEMVR